MTLPVVRVASAKGLVNGRPFGIVTPQEFGAVGDGVADDTSALQAALSAASGGGAVLVPAGTYRLTSTLTVGSRVTFEGMGRSTVFDVNGIPANGTAIRVAATCQRPAPPTEASCGASWERKAWLTAFTSA